MVARIVMQGFLVLAMLATLRAQEGRAGSAPAKHAASAGNALVLYRLAVEEFEPALKVRIPFVRSTPAGPDPQQMAKHERAVAERFAKSVVARSLFAQATRMPTCRFGPEHYRGTPSFDEKLRQLARCIEMQAWKILEDEPEQAAQSACALLRFCRHRRQGWSHLGWRWVMSGESLRREMQRFQLLDRAMRCLPIRSLAGDEDDASLAKRIDAELDLAEAERFPVAHIASWCLEGAKHVVVAHCRERAQKGDATLAEAELLERVRQYLSVRLMPEHTLAPQPLRPFLTRVWQRERAAFAAVKGEDRQVAAVVRRLLQHRDGFALLGRMDKAAQQCRVLVGRLLPAERKEGAAAPNEDAYAVYRLFVDEVERVVSLPLPQPEMTVHGPELEASLAREKSVRRAVERGVVARSLFAQAVSRTQCTFPEDANQGDESFVRKLCDAAHCVTRYADAALANDPVEAAAIACQVLRFADHMRRGLAERTNAAWLDQWTYMRELRALQLLEKALRAIEGKAGWHALSDRVRPELVRVLARQPEPQEIVTAVRAGMPAAIAKYAARLDQPLPRGDASFADEVGRLVDRTLGKPAERGDRVRWLSVVEQRRTQELDGRVDGEGERQQLARKAANAALQTRRLIWRTHLLLVTEARCRALLAPSGARSSRR